MTQDQSNNGLDVELRLRSPGERIDYLMDQVVRLAADGAAANERAEKAEGMAYVPGRWRCARCTLVLTSTNLHVADGGMTANNEPHTCPNGCGPMWRVSERDERKEAQRSYIDLWDQHEALKKRLDARQTELLAANNVEVERRRAAVAESKALRAAIRDFLPRNVCLTNTNIRDSHVVPLECSMGELRRIAALGQPADAASEGATA